MRDYATIFKRLRQYSENCVAYKLDADFANAVTDAADAIEELLAVCREIAAFVMHYSDDGEVSAEILCRKLHKIGVIEKDGAWWTLPAPQKGVE